MTRKRVIAYYDGSNFYHYCKKNYGITDVNFSDIANQIINQEKEELVKIKYFNSPVSQQEDLETYKKQQKFFEKIKRTPLLSLYLGKLVKRPLKKININCPSCGHQKCDCLKCPVCERDLNVNKCFKYTEKGVDVKLAITLLLDGLNNKYDTAFLFSGDADFCPVIEYIIKKLKKDVVYCYFPSPITSQLNQICSDKRMITKKIVDNSQISNKI